MLILDTLLVGGLRFVLDKIASAVDAELNGDTALREELLAAQMRVELGELSEEEFARTEADIVQRLRHLRRRDDADAPAAIGSGDYVITGVDATVRGDEH